MENSGLFSLDSFFSQLTSMYNHHLTEWEALLWQTEVFNVYPEKQIVMALKCHMERSESSRFMPRYGDIKKLLAQDSCSILDLIRLVQKHGSYSAPDVNGLDPILAKTIEGLGGWVQVCKELPSAEDPISMKNYEEKFKKAVERANKKITIENEPVAPLISRVDLALLERAQKEKALSLGYAEQAEHKQLLNLDKSSQIVAIKRQLNKTASCVSSEASGPLK